MGRVTRYRPALNDWVRGPLSPSHDFADVEHLTTYFERRAVIVAMAAWAALVALAAVASELLWGYPDRLFVAIFGIGFWPAAWPLYLRHHYRREFRRSEAPSHPVSPTASGPDIG